MNGITSLIESASYVGAFGLQQAILAGIYAGLLAVPVLLINVICRRWISAGQMGLLWGLVLVRLLLPMAPATSLSLQNLVRSGDVNELQTERANVRLPDAVALVDAADVQSVGTNSALRATVVASYKKGLIPWLLEMIPLLWLSGAVVSISLTITTHWKLSCKLRTLPACQNERLLRLWRTCCQQAGVVTNVPIVIFDGVRQPAVMGAIRPRLLLPASAITLDDERLRLVMLHELAHVRRHDVVINWVLVVIRAVHWWNPVYWAAAARFSSLREQACDAFAIRQGGSPTRVYTELLLTLAERELIGRGWRVTLPASILGFLPLPFGRCGIRNRLKALRLADLRQSRLHATAVVIALVLLAACGLTDAKPPEQTIDTSDWLPKATIDRCTWTIAPPSGNGPVVACTYDISKALDRIATEVAPEGRALMKLVPLLRNVVQANQQLQTAGVAPDPSTVRADAELWQRNFSINGTSLTVDAPVETHAELQRCLKTWEESGFGQVCVECHFLSGFPDLASEMGVSWQYLDTSSPGRTNEFVTEHVSKTPMVRAATGIADYFLVGLATLTDRQARTLRESAQQNRRTNILQAPKVTLFNGQQASILDVTSTPFLIGMRETTVGTREPKIAVVDEGMKIALRASLSSDQASVRLNAQITLSKIGDVRTVAASLGNGTDAIQIPSVKRCCIEVASQVDDGQSLLIGCVPSYDEKRFFYVLLTPRNLPEP